MAVYYVVDPLGNLSAFPGGSTDLTNLNASNLTSGTVPDARFPATLPAASGVNLTALNASNLASGTIPLARISGITNTQIDAAAAIAYSKLALSGSIVNADVNAAAAIAWTKLSKSGSSLADLATRSAADLSSGTLALARLAGITNTEIDAAAAIAWSKISKSGSSLADLATRSAADLSSGILACARLRTILTNSNTGTQNNWAPGLSGDTFVFWSGASDATVTGIAGGVTGQLFGVKNTGTKVCYFTHQSASSSAGNKITNIVTSGTTPIAAGGSIWFMYDGTVWQLVSHAQGAAITPTFSAGDFTTDTGTWTVDSGDVFAYAWTLRGALLLVQFSLDVTTVASSPTQLRIAVPNSFTPSRAVLRSIKILDNGAASYSNCDIPSALNAYIRCFKDAAGSAWAAATDTTYVLGDIEFPVT